jgi:hypothetical protein
MSARVVLEQIINFTIRVVSFWFSYNFYLFIQFCFNSIGIFGVLFDFQFFGSDLIAIFMIFLLLISTLYILYILSLLFWIFVFWMIIKIFVPFVIFIPIPIIPFIIPIPLKMIILENVPPFKLLTERGILPMIEKIIFRFLFSSDTIKSKFSNSLSDVYRFLYDEIKNSIGDALNLMGLKKPEKTEDEKYEVKTVDDGTTNKIQGEKELKDNKEIMDLINEELEICMRSKQALTTPNSDLFNGIKNLNNYSECYSRSIKSYIDNRI